MYEGLYVLIETIFLIAYLGVIQIMQYMSDVILLLLVISSVTVILFICLKIISEDIDD